MKFYNSFLFIENICLYDFVIWQKRMLSVIEYDLHYRRFFPAIRIRLLISCCKSSGNNVTIKMHGTQEYPVNIVMKQSDVTKVSLHLYKDHAGSWYKPRSDAVIEDRSVQLTAPANLLHHMNAPRKYYQTVHIHMLFDKLNWFIMHFKQISFWSGL